MTVSEALTCREMLKKRITELSTLRNSNSKIFTQIMDSRDRESKPVFDALELDRTVITLEQEMSKLDMSIKDTNAKTSLVGYDKSQQELFDLLGRSNLKENK